MARKSRRQSVIATQETVVSEKVFKVGIYANFPNFTHSMPSDL